MIQTTLCAGCRQTAETGYSLKPTPAECREMADFLQGFSNPVRVEILCVLRDGEKSAGEITRRVGAKKSNISQQLRILTAKGYVARRRDERNVYYRVREPEIYEVMEHILHWVAGAGEPVRADMPAGNPSALEAGWASNK